jgi:hypothetical protein
LHPLLSVFASSTIPTSSKTSTRQTGKLKGMIFRKAVLVLAAAIASTATIAHAQLGVYGNVTVNRLTGQQGSPLAPANAGLIDCTGNQAPTCAVNNSVDPLGGGAGVYYDFKTIGPVRLGADLRGTITNSKQGAYSFSRGGGTRIYSALGGIRASFRTPIPIIKPYIQGSVGLGRSDYGLFTTQVTSPATTVTSPTGGTTIVVPATLTNEVVRYSGLQYEGFAGVDLKILPVMDFRVVELGYGALTSFGTNGHTYPIGTLTTGVVFHLPF